MSLRLLFSYILNYNHIISKLVEDILEQALESIGGSIQAIEKALDEIAYQSRDCKPIYSSTVMDIIRKLMTYDRCGMSDTNMYLQCIPIAHVSATQHSDLHPFRLLPYHNFIASSLHFQWP